MMQGGLMAFPDQHFDMQRVVADGDAVVVEWIWTGTHTGTIRDSKGSDHGYWQEGPGSAEARVSASRTAKSLKNAITSIQTR